MTHEKKVYASRECAFCEGGRAQLPAQGCLPAHDQRPAYGDCGRCDGSGRTRAFVYPRPKGWRGPWPPPVPNEAAA